MARINGNERNKDFDLHELAIESRGRQRGSEEILIDGYSPCKGTNNGSSSYRNRGPDSPAPITSEEYFYRCLSGLLSHSILANPRITCAILCQYGNLTKSDGKGIGVKCLPRCIRICFRVRSRQNGADPSLNENNHELIMVNET
jgi:hypothetical protein